MVIDNYHRHVSSKISEMKKIRSNRRIIFEFEIIMQYSKFISNSNLLLRFQIFRQLQLRQREIVIKLQLRQRAIAIDRKVCKIYACHGCKCLHSLNCALGQTTIQCWYRVLHMNHHRAFVVVEQNLFRSGASVQGAGLTLQRPGFEGVHAQGRFLLGITL